jgi:hypothetical protein
MSIASDNVAPHFGDRRRLVVEDLRHLQAPCVIFEHKGSDSDGVDYYVYTIGGYLNGEPLMQGCTVAGQVVLIHADSREDADAMAALGLHDTILSLDEEEAMYIDANAALARLQSVGPVERIDQAIKPNSDKSDAFVEDLNKIRTLVGDDIVLTVGGVEH